MAEYQEQLQYYLDQVRARLRDYAELNRLVEVVESPDKVVAKFLVQAIDWFNGTPPALSVYYSWADFPNRTLLIDITLMYILESVALLDIRNLLPINDGSGVASPHQKGQALWGIAQQLRARVLQETTLLKRSLALREAPTSSGDYLTAMQFLYTYIGWEAR
jgi:hypothetical protein